MDERIGWKDWVAWTHEIRQGKEARGVARTNLPDYWGCLFEAVGRVKNTATHGYKNYVQKLTSVINEDTMTWRTP